MSMRLVTDPRFALRVEDYHAFYDYVNNCKDLTSDDPKKALETIAEQVNEINNKLQKAAIPYGRGGDEKNEWYSDMVSNWNTLYSTFMLPFIYTVRNELRKFDSYIKDDDSDVVTSLDEIQNQAIQKIHYFFTSVYLDCALTVAALSWFGMDVSPQWLGAIQSMMPLNMMGGQPENKRPQKGLGQTPQIEQVPSLGQTPKE
jgi:hypothetical protein